MALTGMAVYKLLPKTNCGDCKVPTCMAFAMQVAGKQKALADCPHVSEEAKSELADASAPPMKLVRIGASEENAVQIGQETVMFRHEKKFVNPPAVAVKIPASLSDADAMAKLEEINGAVFVRIGMDIGVRLAAVDTEGLSPEAAASRLKAMAAKSRVPFVIMGEKPDVMKAAVAAVAEGKPLVYRATPANADAFCGIASDAGCPLAVSAGGIEELAGLAAAAVEKGVPDIVLSFDGSDTAGAIRDITSARRAALKKNFRALGFPAMVDAACGDPLQETALACAFVCKYAGIVLINGTDGSELLPILTTIQNIYTDPQVPNTVEVKTYEVGNVTEDSPVMFTTNFSLTYFCVESEVERSRIPAYISVVDTEGLGVLNAYAGDKMSPEKVVKTLADQKVAGKVKHRKLIIPGLIPSFKAEIEDTSEWKEVIIGPENASGIPNFLAETWKQ